MGGGGGQLPAGGRCAALFLDGCVTSAGLTHDRYPALIIKPLEVHYLSVYAQRERSAARRPILTPAGQTRHYSYLFLKRSQIIYSILMKCSCSLLPGGQDSGTILTKSQFFSLFTHNNLLFDLYIDLTRNEKKIIHISHNLHKPDYLV